MQMQFNSNQVHAYIKLEGAAVTSVEYECAKYNVKNYERREFHPVKRI